MIELVASVDVVTDVETVDDIIGVTVVLSNVPDIAVVGEFEIDTVLE